MKHWKSFVKAGGFICIMALVISTLNLVISPKYLKDNDWPTTQTYMDFYEIEKNTVDVLFLGSSHAVSAFSPAQYYRDYGITSYNLGSEQQNLVVSYYWLKEALRYQNPKVVVLDTYFLFPFVEDSALNSEEFTVRKAIDPMKLSSVKIEAIDTICTIDQSQDKWSYYFPNIRYHNRWTDVKEDDFSVLIENQNGLMGYSAQNYYGYENGGDFFSAYQPFTLPNLEDIYPPQDTMEDYLKKIVTLCVENDIQLVLCKTPTTYMSIFKYNYVQNFVDKYDLKYIDFNESSVYESMAYDILTDNSDPAHVNYKGMQKICRYLGPILLDEYGLEPKEVSQYEESLVEHEAIMAECDLRNETDLKEYLKKINKDRYAVFISAQGNYPVLLDNNMKQGLADLGCTVDFSTMSDCGYVFVKNQGKNIEKTSMELIEEVGTIRNGKTLYSISSAGEVYGRCSSVQVDGTEYSKDSNGINIVVYSLESKKVIDAVCFSAATELGTIR